LIELHPPRPTQVSDSISAGDDRVRVVAVRHFGPAIVRFGQQLPLRACSDQVCFASMIGHLPRPRVGLISAKSGREQLQQTTQLFDHIVSSNEKRQRQL